MNLFDLFAKLTLDTSEYEDGIEDATSKGSKLADSLKSGLKTAGKVGVAALSAAAKGIAALATNSVQNYAEYEQLVGGVETLFKDSADIVMQYANNAFQTAGLSANEYMETVTSFSASLLQSLGGDTEAAASYADRAIIDMADNANKMGTSIESIQNAYQGFAKQNYTMLDNLKLGYGGTQEEMYRLMQDAEKLGATFNSEFYLTTKGQLVADFADITTAIHVIQEEMGIAGATAAEAEGTISGSVSAMKSAWSNFVTGLSDENANMDELMWNLVDSAMNAADNLLERVDVVLGGIGTAVEKIAPVIVEKIPGIITDVVPSLLNAGKELLNGLVKGISDNSESIVDSAFDLVDSLIDGISDMLPDILVAGVELVLQLALGLVEAIPKLVAKIPQIITGIVQGFTDAWPRIKEIGTNIIKGVWEGIQSMASWIKEKVSGFFGGIVDGVKNLLGIHSPSRVFATIGENMALGLGEGWESEYDSIKKEIEDGMDFGTATVDFASSGVGKSSSGIINSVMSSAQSSGGTYTINLIAEGRELAQVVFDPLRGIIKQGGVGLA